VSDASAGIGEALPKLGVEGRIGFVAGCTARVLPAVVDLGAPVSVATARNGARLLWEAARGKAVDVGDVADAVHALPEAEADDADPTTSEFLCMLGLCVLSDALEVVRAPESGDLVVAAGDGVRQLLRTIDVVTGHGSLGPLETAEIEAQQRSVRVLGDPDPVPGGAVAAVRRLSELRAQALEMALPTYLRAR
jgi:hypothetical protein